MANSNKIDLNLTLKGYLGRGEYTRTLFDPIQTHGWYGITSKTRIEEIKKQLKHLSIAKVNNFRIVKAGCGYYILTFKWKSMMTADKITIQKYKSTD